MSVFVVALSAEARPLIDALKLKRLIDKPWPYYSNGEDHLILTGIGQLNAAAACGWMIGHEPTLARVPWLNVGIAGHADLPLGSLCWVERLNYKHGNLYPALHIRSALIGRALQTIEEASTNYPDNSLLDMEGLAFYLSCSRFVPIELLHLLKVVSDNRENSIQAIDKAMTSALIKDNTADILSFAQGLTDLADALPEDTPPELMPCVDAYLHQWRFSHSQKQQLIKLQLRHYALAGDLVAASHLDPQPRDAKQVLAVLHTKTEQLPVVMA